MLRRLSILASLLAALAACASSDSLVMVGAARPAISPAEVKIYSHPPAVYEEIALLNASTSHMFTPGGQKTIDEVIEKLKEQAAKLGANGVLLEGFSDRQTGSVGTGVGGGRRRGRIPGDLQKERPGPRHLRAAGIRTTQRLGLLPRA